MDGSSTERPLRVLRLLPELDFGGVESRVTLQARLHHRADFDLRVCSFHKAGVAARAIRAAGVPVDTLETSPAVRRPAASLALLRYLRRERPDIVHASIAEANFHALAVARLSGVPVVIAEETGMPAHRRLARLVFSQLYRGADAVVGVTQAVCDYVRDVDRAPPGGVELVYNCASPDYFPAARRSPSSGTQPHLLMVGRLTPVKNHETLLKAFAGVLRERPEARLRIVGEGPDRAKIERQLAELGVASAVELLGYRADVRDLLTESRGFLLPSLSEGCSVSLIEAMATAVPPLGSSVPGILEVMGPSLAAEWTAPSGDAAAWTRLMLRLLELDAERWRTAALAAQARAYELFSPDAYVARVEGLYRRLWSRRR